MYQHWDPLKVCIVGKSYPPEFYSYIKSAKVRNVMERIAYETEEDYQTLIKLLEKFGVEVLRPKINPDYDTYLLYQPDKRSWRYMPPPMTPRDYSLMLGTNWFFKLFRPVRGPGEPNTAAEIEEYIQYIKYKKCISAPSVVSYEWNDIVQYIVNSGSTHINLVPKNICDKLNGAMISRIGKDIYMGCWPHDDEAGVLDEIKCFANQFPEYRVGYVKTFGHADATYCPVKPGLIVSLSGYQKNAYDLTFPDWEVVRLPDQSWKKILPFLKLKEKNKGKWWVPGEELNDEFTEYVEQWMDHWVGYVEETVFDVNMLVIDEKNVVCNNYNEYVFAAFDKHGITPHVINFRHRYFWDGGLHCITSDVHREGTMQNYFPSRTYTVPKTYDWYNVMDISN